MVTDPSRACKTTFAVTQEVIPGPGKGGEGAEKRLAERGLERDAANGEAKALDKLGGRTNKTWTVAYGMEGNLPQELECNQLQELALFLPAVLGRVSADKALGRHPRSW